MFPRVDFGHLYKFIVSCGLVLLAAAIVVPWLVLQDSSVLLITQKQIAGLTSQAADLVARKQSQMAFIVVVYPWFSLGLGIAGVALLAWGFRGWRRRQAVMDQKEDLALRSETYSFERLTEAERKAKAEAEAEQEQEEVASNDEGDGEADGEDYGGSVDPRPEPPVPFVPRPDSIPEENAVSRIRRIESQVAELVGRALAKSHHLERDIRLNSNSGAKVVDLLAVPERSDAFPIVFEVKRIGSQTNAASRVRDAFLRAALAASSVYSPNPEWGTAAICIFVLADANDFPSFSGLTYDVLWGLRPLYRMPLGSVVVTEMELEVRSARLADRLHQAIQEARQGNGT